MQGKNVETICVEEFRIGEETPRLSFDESFGRGEMCFDLRNGSNTFKSQVMFAFAFS